MSEHSKQECADFLDRIVYLLDNELDEGECAAACHGITSPIGALVDRSP